MRLLSLNYSRSKISRNYGLDLARVLAAYMVMSGHLVFGGTVATQRPYSDWAGVNEPLPLLSHNSLWRFDSYLLGTYHSALAIIGVSLFFLISGWLMPPMLKKYSRSFFLLNRFLRIFPMLIIAVLLAAAIQYYGGDSTTLDKGNVLATATLTTRLTGKSLTLGVVWTLIIEFEFYILLFVLGKLTQRKILISCMVIVTATYLYALLNRQASPILTDLYFILYMLAGSSARLAFDEFTDTGRKFVIFWPILVLAAFELNRYGCVEILKLHPGQDINLFSLGATVILLCMLAGFGKMIENIQSARWLIEHSSDLTYSIYLTHLALGIFVISRLRHYLPGDYSTLAVTFILVTVFSAITYKFIELPGINTFRKIVARHNENATKTPNPL